MHVLLPADAGMGAVAAAQAWAWSPKSLSFRVSNVPQPIRLAEAWSPAGGKSEAVGEAMLMLAVDSQLSPLLYSYAKLYALSVGTHSKILGIDLGTIATDTDDDADGVTELTSSCGALYLPAAWHELKEFIASKLTATAEGVAQKAARGGGGGGVDGPEEPGWSALLAAFMQERDYRMQRPVGAALCRAHGTNSPLLAGPSDLYQLLGLPPSPSQQDAP
uniref:Uncharacterized protein n=1 Tax=Coccolithus braarudii TaxID=221442 RepID=A0A7S0PXU6_9EUKA